ncbi:DUF624 domain-containing protein [Aquibacillus sp. 3ASR75-11]|uniref:DUF624 domain-containing protein n=1 Tax=Terrihalobacillus insolitus TaxID=2950438 RepID=A0A9X4AM42_9BACI|nr:DUF624 domain-containing protein [Terrihalobacillus insolitus]MDC3423143.1 DUF624 domain-containing protein [Terrihalobacillus insolitus]
MGGWEKFNQIVYWMLKIAYINLLWIFFTVIGLIAFGIFPATAAMFAITRKWIILEERDFKIFQTFWSFYRQDFFKLNGFALIFIVIGYFLYYDVSFLQLNSGSFRFLIPVVMLIAISYVITLLFFFPVFVHFKLKFFQYMKQSFLIALTSPVEVSGMILSAFLLYAMVYLLPGIIPLFTGSLLAVCLTLLSKRAFLRLEKKMGMSVQEQG